jgi:uncharacterized protein YjiS (DUF1127 family)
MTMIFPAANRPAISGLSAGFLHRIGALARAMAAYWDRRAAIRALSERDDRELRDIGLLRSQIEVAVSGNFYSDMARMRSLSISAPRERRDRQTS